MRDGLRNKRMLPLSARKYSTIETTDGTAPVVDQKARYLSQIVIFTPVTGFLWEYCHNVWYDKTTMCQPKNETRIILNILYSCKSIAMKFSTRYPDGLSY